MGGYKCPFAGLNKEGQLRFSEAEYVQGESNMPDLMAQTQGGIASLTNRLGFRPREAMTKSVG